MVLSVVAVVVDDANRLDDADADDDDDEDSWCNNGGLTMKDKRGAKANAAVVKNKSNAATKVGLMICVSLLQYS